MKLMRFWLLFCLFLTHLVNTSAVASQSSSQGSVVSSAHCSSHSDFDLNQTDESEPDHHSQSSNQQEHHADHPCCMHACHWLGQGHFFDIKFPDTLSTDFSKYCSNSNTSQFTKGLFRPPISSIVI